MRISCVQVRSRHCMGLYQDLNLPTRSKCFCRYSMAALAAAKHEHELEPDERHHVHLDAAHMGLGGDDSWSPSVLEVSCAPMAPGRF